jgi:putative endonuclease
MARSEPTGHERGLLAEVRAQLHLRLRGYRILATRFKTPSGEIDIVAQKAGVIVFIEVKQRKTADAAAEAIHTKNQARVTNAALLYLQKHPEYNGMDLRFDALIMGRGGILEHIENAWGA